MSTIFARQSNENSTRCIESHVLPPVGGSNVQFQDSTIEYTDLRTFTPKPQVGLLFVAPGMYWGRDENRNLEQEVAATYGVYIGHKLIAVGCNECLSEGRQSLRSCAGPRGPASGTPALLFWPSDGLRVRVSHDDVAQHRYTSGEMKYLVPDRVENLVDRLGLDDSEDSALLVFVNAFPSYIPATACLFNAIQSRSKGRKASVWGGYFNDDASVAESMGAGNCIVKGALFVLIRITGPRLDSASTIIKCNQSRKEIDEQLLQLRRRLNLRRRSVLLISGPVEIGAAVEGYANCREFKEAAMKVFNEPCIQVLGAFSNMPHTIGVGSWIHGVTKNLNNFIRFCKNSIAIESD